MAFADEVLAADKVIRQKRTSEFFDRLIMEVPDCEEAYDNLSDYKSRLVMVE